MMAGVYYKFYHLKKYAKWLNGSAIGVTGQTWQAIKYTWLIQLITHKQNEILRKSGAQWQRNIPEN